MITPIRLSTHKPFCLKKFFLSKGMGKLLRTLPVFADNLSHKLIRKLYKFHECFHRMTILCKPIFDSLQTFSYRTYCTYELNINFAVSSFLQSKNKH